MAVEKRGEAHMEHLGILQHVLPIIDQQLSSDQHQDRGNVGRSGLGI